MHRRHFNVETTTSTSWGMTHSQLIIINIFPYPTVCDEPCPATPWVRGTLL